MDTTNATVLDPIAAAIPSHLTGVFELTERRLTEIYGISPAAPELIRFWLACATPSRILSEFEEAILDSKRGILKPVKIGSIDEDSL